MRQACRSRPELFGHDLPDGEPWDPTSVDSKQRTQDHLEPSRVTKQSRQLQASSQRRIVSTLFSWRDWPTYVYLPLLAILLIGLPCLGWAGYRRAHRAAMIVDAITMSNPDWQLVLQLARQNPVPGEWLSIEPEEVSELPPSTESGFRLITDTRILDMRRWNPQGSNVDRPVVSYRRMQIRRTESAIDDQIPTNKFRFQQLALTNDIALRTDATELRPVFRITPHLNEGKEIGFMCQAEFDLSGLPIGEDVDVGFEASEIGVQGRSESNNRLQFQIVAPTDVATMWVLLPEDRPYRDFELFEYDPGSPVVVDAIEPTYTFELADGSLFGWMLVAPKDQTTYECRWTWRDE
jgi:hypothetical protein